LPKGIRFCTIESVANGSRALAETLLGKVGVTINGDEPWSIRVRDERVWHRVLAQRQLGFGESYMDGWWECDQMDEMLTRVIAGDLLRQIRPSPKMLAAAATSRVMNRQTKIRAEKNARYHYDIGNDLYERMLDERMVYSCAYWDRADNLTDAQVAKLDLICRKLHLEEGMMILDIGCGWGGFLKFAAERYGVRGVGVSPAGNQVEVAVRQTRGLPIEIRQMEYRDLTGTFDRIVSVGMMEHVGPRNLKSFFDVCDRLLTPDGVMLHHTIGSLISKIHSDPFFDRYIFPGGVLPSLAQFSQAAEPDWVVEDVHNFGPDYDRTLMAWHANIESRWWQIPQYDERFRRMWRFYLLGSAAGFRSRSLQLWQIVVRRKGIAARYQPVREK
jgi:cyclopropane-fatty-acyl-phospholipid synthase